MLQERIDPSSVSVSAQEVTPYANNDGLPCARDGVK
jgi:hypothetical protein